MSITKTYSPTEEMDKKMKELVDSGKFKSMNEIIRKGIELVLNGGGTENNNKQVPVYLFGVVNIGEDTEKILAPQLTEDFKSRVYDFIMLLIQVQAGDGTLKIPEHIIKRFQEEKKRAYQKAICGDKELQEISKEELEELERDNLHS